MSGKFQLKCETDGPPEGISVAYTVWWKTSGPNLRLVYLKTETNSDHVEGQELVDSAYTQRVLDTNVDAP